jgi:hypothetical protein
MGFLLKFLVFVSLIIVSACRPATIDLQGNEIKSTWHFFLNFDESIALVDSEQKSAQELRNQIATALAQRFSFRDPVKSAVGDGFSNRGFTGRFFIGSEKNYSKQLHWVPSGLMNEHWRFAECSMDSRFQQQLISCEAKSFLVCLNQRADDAVTLNSQNQSSTANRSLLMDWASDCGLNGRFENLLDRNVSIKIDKGQVIFSPTPLLSLLVYKGSWSSYEEASVKAVAAATLPDVVPCERSDGACLQSPVPLARCLGCDTLESGKIHTAFFIERLRQNYNDIRSVIFIP